MKLNKDQKMIKNAVKILHEIQCNEDINGVYLCPQFITKTYIILQQAGEKMKEDNIIDNEISKIKNKMKIK